MQSDWKIVMVRKLRITGSLRIAPTLAILEHSQYSGCTEHLEYLESARYTAHSERMECPGSRRTCPWAKGVHNVLILYELTIHYYVHGNAISD